MSLTLKNTAASGNAGRRGLKPRNPARLESAPTTAERLSHSKTAQLCALEKHAYRGRMSLTLKNTAASGDAGRRGLKPRNPTRLESAPTVGECPKTAQPCALGKHAYRGKTSLTLKNTSARHRNAVPPSDAHQSATANSQESCHRQNRHPLSARIADRDTVSRYAQLPPLLQRDCASRA